ncbi:MAG: nitrous oxide reductase accessory protein NosL [Desulfobulbaceae bacterium]|nr:nitrous oxide reductase accessory protein NosL [Desulfobulbaceae bacterium]
MKKNLCKFVLFSCLLALPANVLAVEKAVDTSTRCSVCGMFVAKYPNWLVSLKTSDGETKYFDGVKDMMVFYFAPQKYGAKTGDTIGEITVVDYYSLNPMEARKAFYVVGSDINGPMGHEFIPFKTKADAESFSKDHQGKNILTFEGITPDLVESMRSGQRMK